MQEYQNEHVIITTEDYFTFMPSGKAVIEKAISTADTVNKARRYILLLLIHCMHNIHFEELRHFIYCVLSLFYSPDEFCPTEWH